MVRSNGVRVKRTRDEQSTEVSILYHGQPRIYLGLQKSLFTAYWDCNISPLGFLNVAYDRLADVRADTSCLVSDGQPTSPYSVQFRDLQDQLDRSYHHGAAVLPPNLVRIETGSSAYVWQVWSESDHSMIVGTISQVQNLHEIEGLYNASRIRAREERTERVTSEDELPEPVRQEVLQLLQSYPSQLVSMGFG